MEYIKSAIEKYDNRDYKEELIWDIWNKYQWEKNAIWCFSNIKYNQLYVDRYSCTWQAACWVISDVTNFALPLSFRRTVWQNQLNTWAKEWMWDYVQNWMKQAVKLFNEEFKELPFKLEYFRIEDIRKDEIFNVLKNSSILTWYRGSLFSDSQDNWVIDNTDNSWNWWHAIRIVKAWKEWDNIYVKYVDNYEWKNKYNVIKVLELNNNKDFFKWWYYIKKVNK